MRHVRERSVVDAGPLASRPADAAKGLMQGVIGIGHNAREMEAIEP